MNWIEIFTLVFSTILGGSWLVNLVTVKSQKKKAEADADSADIDNAKKIVDLWKDYAETKKASDGEQITALSSEVTELKTEVNGLKGTIDKMDKTINRLIKALNKSKECPHADNCPVQNELKKDPHNEN
jgi:predicted RNase H-like nuclease (RuvC/YqgF family)